MKLVYQKVEIWQLNNAKSDICLLADDDIVYENDFDSIILNAFNLKSQCRYNYI